MVLHGWYASAEFHSFEYIAFLLWQNLQDKYTK